MNWPLATGIAPIGQLHQHAQPLPRRGRVGDHDLAAVDGVDDELAGDVLVELLAVLLAEAVARLVEVLADEHRHLAVRGRRRVRTSSWKAMTGPAGPRFILPSVERDLVLGRLERQVEHRQGEHHLGEVAAGVGEVPRQERAVAVVAWRSPPRTG